MSRGPRRSANRSATRKLSFVSAVLCCAFFPRSPLPAATLTWTGSAGDGNVATAGNWSPAQSPLLGDLLIFAGTSSLLAQLTSSLSVGSLSFNATAGCLHPRRRRDLHDHDRGGNFKQQHEHADD